MFRVALAMLCLVFTINGSSADLVYTWPSPNAQWQSTATAVILGFDGMVPRDLSVSISGSLSGDADFSEYIAQEGTRMVLSPRLGFIHGETVDVSVRFASTSADFSFIIRPVDPEIPISSSAPHSLPDQSDGFENLHSLNITSERSAAVPSDFPQLVFEPTGSQAPGSIFFSPFFPTGGNTSTYLIVANSDAEILYYRNSVGPFVNFEVQINGNLTFTNVKPGSDSDPWMEMDQTFTMVDSFSVIGYPTDAHDFTVAGNNNLLLLGSDFRYIDMSQIVPGGNPNALVRGLLIQEQDRNHMPVFQWSSFDHMEITDACDYIDLTASYINYVHCNSIEEDSDGNLIVSLLSMSECTKIDRTTGDVIWRFGGYMSKNPDFTIIGDPLNGFSAQHDFKHVSGNLYSVLDNGTHHLYPMSRACLYQLNTTEMTAELVSSYSIEGLYGSHMGSVRVLPNGNIFVGWGDVTGSVPMPDMTEFTPGGEIVFSGRMNLISHESYHAYRHEWEGQAAVPYLVALALPSQACVELTYNVFGSIPYGTYDIYHGTEPGSLSLLTSTPDRQTLLNELPQGMNYFRVVARDIQGVPTEQSNLDSALVNWTGISETQPDLGISIHIHPCPAARSVTVTWPHVEGEPEMLTIYDISGRAVHTHLPENGDSGFAVINLDNIPAGVYMVRFSSPVRQATGRMVVIDR